MPHNILHADVSEDALVNALKSRPPLLPVLGAAAWRKTARNSQAQHLLAPLHALAERERDTPLPVLTDDLYAEFHRTGSRVAFSEAYFQRRRMLSHAALCALLGGEREQNVWLPVLVERLRGVLDEASWALTAHVGSPTGKDPMNIDLFAAETANTLGELLAVFEAVLPEKLTVAVRARLRTRIFQNYLDNPDRFGWARQTHNWNAVCHQGILGAALAAETDTRVVARLLLLAKQGLPHFLAGFGEDGGCSEGPGYWGYGFGWFCFLNEQLETASQDTLSIVEGDEHVRQIALFYPRAAFCNGYMVNYSDSAPHGCPNPRLLSYLGERLNNDQLRACGHEAWRNLMHNGPRLEAERCDFFYLARLLRDCPPDVPKDAAPPRRDFYFHDLRVLVAHREDAAGNLWEFAVKGGNNGEHHNHNDCGSYLLNINGRPFVTETGAPEYNKEYFGPERYRNFAARTLGHSLPIVNGYEQSAGSEFAAVVLQHELTPAGVRFVVDLTRCYSPEADCRSLIRTVEFHAAAGTLSVTDDYELAEARSWETAVITNQRVQFAVNSLLIISDDRKVFLRPAPATHIAEMGEQVVRVNASVHARDTSLVRRIVLRPTQLAAQGTVGCQFSLSPDTKQTN